MLVDHRDPPQPWTLYCTVSTSTNYNFLHVPNIVLRLQKQGLYCCEVPAVYTSIQLFESIGVHTLDVAADAITAKPYILQNILF